MDIIKNYKPKQRNQKDPDFKSFGTQNNFIQDGWILFRHNKITLPYKISIALLYKSKVQLFDHQILLLRNAKRTAQGCFFTKKILF